MAKHFTGTYDHKMDDKGRVSLPTQFRRVLDDVDKELEDRSVYLVPQLEDRRALAFFSNKGYDKLIDLHNGADYATVADEHRMEVKLVTRAGHLQIDDAGRLVLSKPLREMIGLEKEVRFVGLGARFEIWRPDEREAYESDLMAPEAEAPIRLDYRRLHD